ncbi:MAG: cysteine desulfurase [Gammaproteobacteria bacterium]|nr:MAG: cysteine desulfurase [Gammaproteobacteria bacterium]
MSTLTVEQITALRQDFPILDQEVNGKPLVYLDNAATSQKPQAVLDALQAYYTRDNSNVHRGAHTLSNRATERFEAARETVRAFLNARETAEIVWTRGTTEAINLVAQSWGRTFLKRGDLAVITALDHHSNIVPWQILREQLGIELAHVPVTPDGHLDQDAYDQLLKRGPKLVAFNQVSNAIGTRNPAAEMIRKAREAGAITVLDGAQATPHFRVDVQALDCDFYAFSGHKVFGPTGIGALYGRRELLEAMPPWHGGGEMIEHVTLEGFIPNALPFKFEAGTPAIAQVVGLAAAIDYLNAQDRQALEAHELNLLKMATDGVREIPGARILADHTDKVAVLSFLIEGTHPADIGTLLDQQGIAVRTGHHCTMPLMQHFGVPGSVRASFAFYNTEEDVRRLLEGLKKVLRFLL